MKTKSVHLFLPLLFIAFLLVTGTSCKTEKNTSSSQEKKPQENTLLKTYVDQPDSAFTFELRNTIKGKGFTAYVLYLQSQRWLTLHEVKDNLWWHWLTIVVPDHVKNDMGMLIIGGGGRDRALPTKADPMAIDLALSTQTVIADLHNVPNQPQVFIGDNYGPREEDEIIAYGWRKFLEGGALDKDAQWLLRLPMTKSSVRAMDAITAFCKGNLNVPVNRFTVMGGSKRGWTTWTTAAVDNRVKAIVPGVIDMLNFVPSFHHHWRVYGDWARAVKDYRHEGIMEWLDTEECKKMLAITEPYSFREKLTMPKFIVNASGDEFFVSDSWKFYWDGLRGEKHLRYIPNANHSLDGSDYYISLKAFYQGIVENKPRPDFDWTVDAQQKIHLTTKPEFTPDSILVWSAENETARDFRVETFGKKWTKKSIPIRADGHYLIQVDPPVKGWKAFFAELKFKGVGPEPYIFSTGIVVTPDQYAYQPYTGTKKTNTGK